MANEWIGLVATNAPDFAKGFEDLTVRSRYILSLAKQRGRFEYNKKGYEWNWQVQFDQQNVTQYADGGNLDFERSDLFRRLTIDSRGYTATDKMTDKEKEQYGGNTGLINRYNEIGKLLMQSMSDKFGGELYKDGNAAGRESSIHGIESFMGSGTTVAADLVAQPSDTYAGRSTALAADGGTWSSVLTTSPNAAVDTDWPNGQGDSKYDYMAPKLLNWSSSNWGTSSATWASNGHFVISQGQTWLTMTGGAKGAVDVFVCAADLFQGYKNSLATLRRVIVPHKGANDLGFGMAINQDGMAIMPDFDCPVNTGYFINVDQMKICSQTANLFFSKGPEYDIKTNAFLWLMGFYGNCQWNPKWHGKAYNYAA
jgi:hypothetical protein